MKKYTRAIINIYKEVFPCLLDMYNKKLFYVTLSLPTGDVLKINNQEYINKDGGFINSSNGSQFQCSNSGYED